MSASHDPQFEDLLSRYLDAELSAADERLLAEYLSDETLAKRFLEMTKLNAEIEGLSASPVPDTVMAELVLNDLRGAPDEFLIPTSAKDYSGTKGRIFARTSTRSKSRALALLALTACVCLLAAAGFHFIRGAQEKPLSSVATVTGEVYFIDASGKKTLAGDQPLAGDGKIETVGPDSRVTLVLADGTRLELEGDTTLTMELKQPKPRLFLKDGCFHAKVAKQGQGRAILFDTMNAEATVHGTEFTLLWHESSSYLMVTEGSVAIRRLTDGPEIVVNAGYYCHIEPAGVYHTWPKSYLPKWFNSGAPLHR